MKPHLPIALRSALLACAAMVSTVAPAAVPDGVLAEGINSLDVTLSDRFYDSGKGYYFVDWASYDTPYQSAKKLYEQTGSFDFMGDLARYINHPEQGFSEDSFVNLRTDADSCWRQTAANIIEYWTSFYGVFYKGDKPLSYGYTYDKQYLSDLAGTQSLALTMLFHNNWNDVGGLLPMALNWYFGGDNSDPDLKAGHTDKGGYFSNYFNGQDICTVKYYDGQNHGVGTDSSPDINKLKQEIFTALGYNGDKLNMDSHGNLVYLALYNLETTLYDGSVQPFYSCGHAITCYGFEATGQKDVLRLLVANSDDLVYGFDTLYVKNVDGLLHVFTDAACTQNWTYAGLRWFLGNIGSINTPQVLQDMLASYTDSANPIVWNGCKADLTWHETDAAVVEILPGSSDGWKVKVGDEYYHSYYQPNRPVEFNENSLAGVNKTSEMKIDGTVHTPHLILNSRDNDHEYLFSISGVHEGAQDTLRADELTFVTNSTYRLDGVHVVAESASTGSKGWLELQNGAKLSINSDFDLSNANLYLKGATVDTGKLIVRKGSTLRLQGHNVLTGNLVWDDASTLRLKPGSESLLTVMGSLSVGDFLDISLDLADGESLDKKAYSVVSFGDAISGDYAGMQIQGASNYHFVVSGASLILRDGDASVSFDKGDAMWTDGAAGFFNDDMPKVEFNGGTISTYGTVTPSEIIVQGKADTTLTSADAGTIAGVGGLTKTGAGKLTINMANSFTGGTLIKEGSVVLNDAAALGTGLIALQGGTLELNSLGVKNAIAAKGGTISGAGQYQGDLTVRGKVTIGHETSANSVTIDGGNLQKGSLHTPMLILKGGDISTSLYGDTAIFCDGPGETKISGNNSHTGVTTVTGGTLTLKNLSALGSGAIVLTGGKLNMGSYAITNSITAGTATISYASKYRGSITVTKGHTLTIGSNNQIQLTLDGSHVQGDISSPTKLTVTGQSSISGTLTLENTKFYFDSANCKLSVGKLEAKKGESYLYIGDVSNFRTGIHTIINADSVSINWDALRLDISGQDERDLRSFSLGTSPDGLTLVITDPLNETGTGTWVLTPGYDYWGNGLHNYKNGMDVSITEGQTVCISGTVAPKSIHITADNNVFMTNGSIGGDVVIQKEGKGILVFKHANSYSGDTLVLGGAVEGAVDGAFGTSNVRIDAAKVYLDGKNHAGSHITFNDAGTVDAGKGGRVTDLTVSTPGLIDVDGRLLFGGDGVIKGNAKVDSLVVEQGSVNGTIEVANIITAKAGAIIGNISGGAFLNKQTDGYLLLDGKFSYTGQTNIQAGTVMFWTKSSMQAHTVVQNNATLVLRGDNTFSSGLVLNGDAANLTIRGDVSIFDLNLSGGTVRLDAGTTVKIPHELMLNRETQLFVSGLADMDKGTPVLICSFGALVNNTGKSLSDVFFNLLSQGYEAFEDNGNLYIQYTGVSAPLTSAVADVEAGDEADGEVLTEAAPQVLADAAPGAAPAAPQEALAQSAWGAARAARIFDHTMRDRNGASGQALDATGTRSVWFSALSDFSRTDSQGTGVGGDIDLYGGVIGIQFNSAAGSNVGLAVGQTWGHVSPMGVEKVTQKSQHAGVYATKSLVDKERDSAWLTATAGYSTTDSDMDHNGHSFYWNQQAAAAGVRATWSHACTQSFAINGFAGMEYLATSSGHTENGKTGSVQQLQAGIGLGFSYTKGKFSMYGDAAFTPDLVRHNPVATSGDVPGRVANPGRLGYSVGVGANYRVRSNWGVNAGYSFESARNINSHNVNVGTTYSF